MLGTKEVVIKWELFENLDAPCSDISYQWISERGARLVITMHFSRVIDGFEKDLELTFLDPIALQWEEESFGIIELPNPLPKCTNTRFSSWTFPTLIIPNSEWANTYAARTHTTEEFEHHKITHFSFISMNDLLHVLSEEKPTIRLL